MNKIPLKKQSNDHSQDRLQAAIDAIRATPPPEAAVQRATERAMQWANALPQTGTPTEALPMVAASPDRESWWMRRAAAAVAAAMFFGIVSNVWASWRADRFMAKLLGPPPVSKQAMEIAQEIGRITDPQTAQWVYHRLTPRPQPGDGLAAYTAYCRLLNQITRESFAFIKEPDDATPKTDSEMERNRTRRPDGDPFGCQRPLRLDYRRAA
jgi:hypothetical protein